MVHIWVLNMKNLSQCLHNDILFFDKEPSNSDGNSNGVFFQNKICKKYLTYITLVDRRSKGFV